MDQEQFNERLVELLREERQEPQRWWYLSFATEGKFNGGVIIKAHGPTDAILTCHLLKINPGGQVLSSPILDVELPAEKYRERLLSKNDIREFWPEAKSVREWGEAEPC